MAITTALTAMARDWVVVNCPVSTAKTVADPSGSTITNKAIKAEMNVLII
jgi:hypothetical protein